jgi:hypothetical protein
MDDTNVSLKAGQGQLCAYPVFIFINPSSVFENGYRLVNFYITGYRT